MSSYRYKVVVIEDLNVSGMLKNHKLAGSIADCGFYEFKRQLEYKAKLYDCQFRAVASYYAHPLPFLLFNEHISIL